MNIRCYNFNLSISQSVLKIFNRYVQIHPKSPESGGILTGEIYDNIINLLNCSEPSDLDQRSRYNFNRSFIAAQKFINEKFKISSGKEIYLGEWHTHPEDHPSPSNTDIKNFLKTIKNNHLNSNVHFMIIIGRLSIYIEIYIDKKFDEKIIVTISDL